DRLAPCFRGSQSGRAGAEAKEGALFLLRYESSRGRDDGARRAHLPETRPPRGNRKGAGVAHEAGRVTGGERAGGRDASPAPSVAVHALRLGIFVLEALGDERQAMVGLVIERRGSRRAPAPLQNF